MAAGVFRCNRKTGFFVTRRSIIRSTGIAYSNAYIYVSVDNFSLTNPNMSRILNILHALLSFCVCPISTIHWHVRPWFGQILIHSAQKPVWAILSQTPAFGKQNCQCKEYMSTQNRQGFLSFLFWYRRYEWQPYYALKKRFNILTFRCPMNKI